LSAIAAYRLPVAASLAAAGLFIARNLNKTVKETA
jgi:hypothetical protein